MAQPTFSFTFNTYACTTKMTQPVYLWYYCVLRQHLPLSYMLLHGAPKDLRSCQSTKNIETLLMYSCQATICMALLRVKVQALTMGCIMYCKQLQYITMYVCSCFVYVSVTIMFSLSCWSFLRTIGIGFSPFGMFGEDHCVSGAMKCIFFTLDEWR